MSRERCSSCGAAIAWVVTAARGRPMPLDVEASADGGNIRVEHGTAHVLAGDALEAARAAAAAGTGPRLWTSHHRTCPNAAAHRRRP